MAKRSREQQIEVSPRLQQDIHDRIAAGLRDPSSPASQFIRLILSSVVKEVLAERDAAHDTASKPQLKDLPNRKVPLAQWAALNYNPAPSAWTLRQWVRSGQIVPAPEKVGKGYYVAPDAMRVSDSTPRGALADFLNSTTPSPSPTRRRRR